MKRKVKAFNEGYAKGEITFEDIKQSVASWVGHAKHGNTYRLRGKILGGILLKRKTELEEVL